MKQFCYISNVTFVSLSLRCVCVRVMCQCACYECKSVSLSLLLSFRICFYSRFTAHKNIIISSHPTPYYSVTLLPMVRL
ncbi:hypothetical protein AAZX31_20G178700 [Glycine max]